ncbi:hypothetical protein QMP26_33205 [Enterocloster clostridioformis]
MKSLKLSKRMEQAVELMKQEEFYLCELPNWSFWGPIICRGKPLELTP